MPFVPVTLQFTIWRDHHKGVRPWVIGQIRWYIPIWIQSTTVHDSILFEERKCSIQMRDTKELPTFVAAKVALT